MLGKRAFQLLWVIVGLSLGGCPLSTSTGADTSDSGSGSTTSTTGTTGSTSTTGTTGPAGSAITAGGSDADDDEFNDSLTAEFPGCVEATHGDDWRDEVLDLVNQARADAGADPLTRNEILEQQATRYACEMLAYEFFDHVNPVTGSTLADRSEEFDYDYWVIGENLAAGQRTPEEVVDDWLDSPCHRQNILNPAFTELGIGVRVGGTYDYYWVQEFGRPVEAGPYTGTPYSEPGCDN